MKWVWIVGGSLLALLVVGVLVLVALGYREGAGRIEGSVEIARTPSELWPWITEGERNKEWVSWLTEVHDLTPGRVGVGSQRRWVMIDPTMNNQRVEIDSEYTQFEPPQVSSVRLHSPEMFRGTATYRLTDLGNGRTRVEYVSQFQMQHWMASLFEPLVTPQAQKKAEDDLARLKQAAEQRAPAARAEAP